MKLSAFLLPWLQKEKAFWCQDLKIVYYLPTYLLEWKVLLAAIWSMNWYAFIKSDFSFRSANLTTFPAPFLQIRNDDMNDHRKFSLFITSSECMIRKNILKLKISICIKSDTKLFPFLSFIQNKILLTDKID